MNDITETNELTPLSELTYTNILRTKGEGLHCLTCTGQQLYEAAMRDIEIYKKWLHLKKLHEYLAENLTEEEIYDACAKIENGVTI